MLGIAVAAWPAPAVAAGGCTMGLPVGSHPVTVQVAGVTRSAVVHVPPSLVAGTRVPLVLALHGWGGNGARMESYSGFSPIADRHGFIVAYPSSDGPGWNSTASASGPDDVAFLRSLIGALVARGCADPGRVYATGVSNGGGMVARAACLLAREIAAIAPVAGDYTRQPPCRPALPVSVLEIHGTADQVAAYYGGGPPTADRLPPFVNLWAGIDGCPRRQAGALATRTRLYRFSGCVGGVRVWHIRIAHGKHQWPGATPPDPGPPATICAACTIWSFFSSLRGVVRQWSASGGAGLQ